LTIIKTDILGTANIGIYCTACNKVIIIPTKVSGAKTEKLAECLKAPVVSTGIGDTALVGVFIVANSNGIAVPEFTSDDEIKAIKSVFEGNVERVASKQNALGNLVLANDKGAIVSEMLAMFEEDAFKKLKDVLGVEMVKGTVADLPYVGSLAKVTNKGGLVHPMATEKELQLLSDVLKVQMDVGTINGGIPFISSGILANDNGAIVGNLTTGPEVLIISNILDV
jgi:translation initiation factor 6